jgi:hypothetical protein
MYCRSTRSDTAKQQAQPEQYTQNTTIRTCNQERTRRHTFALIDQHVCTFRIDVIGNYDALGDKALVSHSMVNAFDQLQCLWTRRCTHVQHQVLGFNLKEERWDHWNLWTRESVKSYRLANLCWFGSVLNVRRKVSPCDVWILQWIHGKTDTRLWMCICICICEYVCEYLYTCMLIEEKTDHTCSWRLMRPVAPSRIRNWWVGLSTAARRMSPRVALICQAFSPGYHAMGFGGFCTITRSPFLPSQSIGYGADNCRVCANRNYQLNRCMKMLNKWCQMLDKHSSVGVPNTFQHRNECLGFSVVTLQTTLYLSDRCACGAKEMSAIHDPRHQVMLSVRCSVLNFFSEYHCEVSIVFPCSAAIWSTSPIGWAIHHK